MTLIGYDSVNPQDIPADAAVIFPYADGEFRWTAKDLRRFPHAARRFITIEANAHLANIFDVERGAGTVEQARPFVQERTRLFPNTIPTIYCNRSTADLVIPALDGLAWRLFLATLDGSKPTSYSGKHCGAVQFKGGAGALYDESVIFDTSWPRKP